MERAAVFSTVVLLAWLFIGLAKGNRVSSGEFTNEQDRYPRVRIARKRTKQIRDSLTSAAGVGHPLRGIYIRAFKLEEMVELWVRGNSGSVYHLVGQYPFTAFSGTLGPKRAEGDFQIPEGCYHIDRFNPLSKYHLSLGLDYPNDSDRIRASSPNPGCDIFIHGDEATIGCIPIGDQAIEVLYVFAVDARDAGQQDIPVHIFPCEMRYSLCGETLQSLASRWPSADMLWKELESVYDAFEQTKIPPSVDIDPGGEYRVVVTNP